MLLGTYSPRLDDKGRMFLPAKFRDKLAGGVVMTRGQERCLYVYPMAEFEKVAERLQSGPTTNAGVRAHQRLLLSGASDEIPDKQGRVTVPAILREYAGLSHECTVIGSGDRLEIWDAQAWATYVADHEDAFANQSEEVVPGL
ncbi:division/cell wall cluster transcriptional repressor MraZ [Ornithinimicrobium sp. F0845]|uniref:division/cell wall cluster transcriptional repressor MraZ n=1 Tax=Ornithinimicrobium sp. F0845 TaxID=2926412 RepID=UPI001FF2B81F|nr:division/cell wall cluster transcriptional repressor MraZ [Ornithinimicrobium sp. F0845]MCK0112660.1 division/cell wall cluster transcriptional repressor MraZ [Ornithinimicrobium sp. F0845]